MKNKDLAVQKVIHMIETLVYNLNNTEEHEKKILQAILSEQEDEQLRNVSLSLAELHVIDCIERNEWMNTTAIAKKLTITKGGISKITAKLIQKNMIEVQRLPNNQKEIYYTVTPLGKKIFQVHEVLHERAAGEFTVCLNTYNKEELQLIDKFLGDLITIFQSTLEGRKK